MHCKAQGTGFVRLDGKQFKDENGNNFYPMVMNYGVDIVRDVSSNYYFSPSHAYNTTNVYECSMGPLFQACSITEMQNDFNYIASMGFNAVRITGLINPRYNGTQLEFTTYDDQAGVTTYYPLDPTNPNDPGMAILLPFYDMVLSLANSTVNSATSQAAPLKVIFLLTGQESSFDSNVISAYNDFLAAISLHLASAANNNALFAYDLINEPAYHVIYPFKTKQQACDMINTWYTTYKTYDPNHLVTLGSSGHGDVFSFDPGIIKVDFLSAHEYTSWLAQYEDRSLPAIQQRMRTRTANNYYWMKENSPVPWMIGETGFRATDPSVVSDWFGKNLDGSLSDLDDYANYSLQISCNCGASGYSWWDYQDGHYADVSDLASYPGNFTGLLLWNYAPSTPAEKPVVSTFRTYTPAVTGTCPVDRTPAYDASTLYYNPYQHPYPDSKTITGTITDQDGNPIKDAVIGAQTAAIDDDGVFHYDYHYTFSDDNGHFECIPYNYFFTTTSFPPPSPPVLPIDVFILSMVVSASGTETKRFIDPSFISFWCYANAQPNPNHDPCETMPAPNSNAAITLQRIKFTYDNNISNITVASGTRNFKGYNSLTTTDITVQNGAVSDFTAGNEVHLLPGFDANAGSEVHIYNTPTSADCSDYSSFLWEIRTGNNSQQDNHQGSQTNEIELSFKKPFGNGALVVTPNPGTGQFTVRLSDDSKMMRHIEICNVMGEKVYSSIINSQSAIINLDLNEGVYFIKAETQTGSYFQKIIIQY